MEQRCLQPDGPATATVKDQLTPFTVICCRGWRRHCFVCRRHGSGPGKAAQGPVELVAQRSPHQALQPFLGSNRQSRGLTDRIRTTPALATSLISISRFKYVCASPRTAQCPIESLIQWVAQERWGGVGPFDKWRRPFHNGSVNTTVTLDRAGRVVIPKTLRDELRLESGDALELESDGERVTLRPVRSLSPLRKERGVWVFRNGRKLSAIVTDDALRDIRDRRDRENRGLRQ